MQMSNQGKLIIIEGPDECGKTTLARTLAIALNGVALHSTASKALFQALPDYHKNILDNCEQNVELGRTVILDRFWPSEVAYGLKMFRSDSNYDLVADKLHERIKKLNYLYVFCFSPGSWNRYKQGHVDPAHSLTKDQYCEIWKSYERLHDNMKKLGDNVLLYIFDHDGTEESLPHYINLVRSRL